MDLGKRISTSAPPIITRPRLKTDLRGLSSIKELLLLIGADSETFPFCRELALYLLLIASIWPDNKDYLLTAGRIFSAALNFHVARTPVDRMVRFGDDEVVFGDAFPAKGLDEFNKKFFNRIGGPESVLFCPSIEQFHRNVWKRANELLIVHDVIHFLVKAAKHRCKSGACPECTNAARRLFTKTLRRYLKNKSNVVCVTIVPADGITKKGTL
jgi:hypothetical protein